MAHIRMVLARRDGVQRRGEYWWKKASHAGQPIEYYLHVGVEGEPLGSLDQPVLGPIQIVTDRYRRWVCRS